VQCHWSEQLPGGAWRAGEYSNSSFPTYLLAHWAGDRKSASACGLRASALRLLDVVELSVEIRQFDCQTPQLVCDF
jgi:hypothetical protein